MPTPPRSVPPKPPTRPIVLACWVALAAVIAYWPILPNQFTYDDFASVANNPKMGLLLHPSTYFTAQYFDVSNEYSYRPLLSLSYGLEHALWGNLPFGYHLVNLLLHAALSALLVPVCFSLGAPRVVALAAGLLYAVHPLRSEAVCGIGFREDLLCALFYLAAFALWPAFRWPEAADSRRETRPQRGPGRPPAESPVGPFPLAPAWRLGLAFLGFVLALLSKEMALSFPILVLAKDFRGGSLASVRRSGFVKRRLPWHVGTWLLAAGALTLFLTFRTSDMSLPQFAGVSLARRLAGALWIALRYLGLFLCPYPLRADHIVDLRGNPIWPAGLASGLVLAVVGLVCFRKRVSFPAVWHAFAAFIILVLPVSNIVPLAHPMAERYLTLPLAPLCYLAPHVLARWRAQTGRRVLLGLVLTILAIVSWRRSTEWFSDQALWSAEVAHGTRSALAYNNLATISFHQGRLSDAEKELKEALRLWPDCPLALADLGGVYLKMGQYAQAEKCLRRSIEVEPGQVGAHANLALVLAKTGRNSEAEAECDLTLHCRRGESQAYDTAGAARFQMQDLAGAEKMFREAVRLEPKNAERYSNLGGVLMARNQYAEAIQAYQTALSLNPNLAIASQGIAVSLLGQNRMEDAIRVFEQFIDVHPGLSDAYVRFGTALLQAGQRDEGRKWLERGLAAARRQGDSAAEDAIRKILATVP